MRQLLVIGAASVIRFARPGSRSASAWLLGVLERRPRKVATVALAMTVRGEAYRRQPTAA